MSTGVATDVDRIEYLILRRYPGAEMLKIPPTLSARTRHYPGTRQLRADVEAYRAELCALSVEQLRESYATERKKEAEALQRRVEEQERALPFNQPYAVADFVHWSRTAHWTLDEAIALSFGKAPEVVSWDNVKSHVQLSPLAAQYMRRRDLALRAHQWGQLFDPVLPGIFLAWAKRLEIPVAPELVTAVEARGTLIADWKTLYEKAKELCEKMQANSAEAESQWRDLSDQKDRVIESLTARLATLDAPKLETAAPASAKEIGTREQDSLLKLVIAMAVRGYRYDPNAARNPQVTDILDDVAATGLTIDRDTVLKWLRRAAALLPGDFKAS